MIIISWDVGIIHLAYCVLEYDDDNNIKILDWDEINLMEDECIKLSCCGKLQKTSNICDKNATYYLNINGNHYGFCKTHLSQHTDYWSLNDTKKLFTNIDEEKKCIFTKNDGSTCDKKSKFLFKQNQEKKYFCTTHYKSYLHKKIKELSPMPIKNLIAKKYPTADLQLILIKKLDSLSEHFSKIGIEEVVIENQPSMKNPKMKAIADTLFNYFMIRGYIDKIHNLDIKLVRFMCPNNKLRVNESNTIEVFKSNKDHKKKYKLTKALGIQYTKQLLENSPEQLEYLELYHKKDDICDAYLQGRYYLEFIKNNNNVNKTKKVNLSRKIKKFKKLSESKNNKVVTL